MARLLSPLRSWLKEERRLLPRSVRLRWLGLCSLLLLALLLALEARRREARLSAALDRQRLEQLELVGEALSDISRTAFDWARWDDSLRFVQGLHPSFVQQDLVKSPVFATGGVMILFDRHGEPLVSASSAGVDQPAARPLQSCARASLASLTSLASAVQLFCPDAERRPYLGVLAQVSNTASTVSGEGALVMFEPMIGPAQGPRLRAQLQALAAQMVSGGSGGLRSLPRSIPLHGSDGRPIALLPQSSLPLLLDSLRDDLILVLALLAPLLVIRLQIGRAHV